MLQSPTGTKGYTRPVYHQRDENITGYIFCSFLALALRKELDRRIEKSGHYIEWAEISNRA